MPTDTKLKELIINELTEEQYNALTPNENELYLTPDNSTPDTKTISLFGNHSILVPKDSTDTNIDLYNHAIEISGTTSGNYDYSIWFNVVSSKNLVVDSLTDLKTLLGNTFKREVFGFSNTSTTPTAIIGIDETQMYNTNGETTSFANLSSITFTDTVTTI